MSKLVPITLEKYENKFWKRFDSYKFIEKDSLSPIVGAEIYRAIHSFPMAFIEQGNSFSLVGLMSIMPGQNMFVAQNGEWLGSYVPAAFRSYPFRMAKLEGQDDLSLCVDADSGLISDTEGEPFFGKQGQLAKPVKDILDFLSQIEQNRIVTGLAVSALHNAKLITKWPLRVKLGEEEKSITGLYMVDEGKLNSLDDEEFLLLRKNGSLAMAYAQLLSMANISVFEKLSQIQQQYAADDMDADSIFGDDEAFKF